MFRLLLNWLLNAVALMLIAHFVPGFHVSGFVPALIAALVIGLLNVTLGAILKIITFPLSIITFGLFLLVINALMLELAAKFVTGFTIHGFLAAFIGAVILAIVQMLFHDTKSSK